MVKLTKKNMAKRFRWSRYYKSDPDGKPAIRMTCSVDGAGAKVTQCRDLSPEDIADAGKWMIEIAQTLKDIRLDAAKATKPKRNRRAA